MILLSGASPVLLIASSGFGVKKQIRNTNIGMQTDAPPAAADALLYCRLATRG